MYGFNVFKPGGQKAFDSANASLVCVGRGRYTFSSAWSSDFFATSRTDHSIPNRTSVGIAGDSFDGSGNISVLGQVITPPQGVHFDTAGTIVFVRCTYGLYFGQFKRFYNVDSGRLNVTSMFVEGSVPAGAYFDVYVFMPVSYDSTFFPSGHGMVVYRADGTPAFYSGLPTISIAEYRRVSYPYSLYEYRDGTQYGFFAPVGGSFNTGLAYTHPLISYERYDQLGFGSGPDEDTDGIAVFRVQADGLRTYWTHSGEEAPDPLKVIPTAFDILAINPALYADQYDHSLPLIEVPLP
jgi:hypothetical protein